ncbi:MAG: SMI1/KNR4 family protein [Thermoactinomyces sp.]
MSDFSFLKKYVLPSEHVKAPPEQKHIFYSLDEREIEEAEKRLNQKFPKELREFYLQIGYGFMCKSGKNMFINRIMDPHSVADLILGENIYEDYYLVDEIAEDPHLFPFFEVGDDSFIFLDLSKETKYYPVIWELFQVAYSLEQFLRKLDDQENYYLSYVDEEEVD